MDKFLPGKNILAGVPQGSDLGSIFFLVYINDLPDGIKWKSKRFADGTSLFSKTKNKNCSTVELDNDLKIISKWAFQWNKQAVKILFSKIQEKDHYLPLNCSGNNLQTAISRKDLGLALDSKLDFN